MRRTVVGQSVGLYIAKRILVFELITYCPLGDIPNGNLGAFSWFMIANHIVRSVRAGDSANSYRSVLLAVDASVRAEGSATDVDVQCLQAGEISMNSNTCILVGCAALRTTGVLCSDTQSASWAVLPNRHASMPPNKPVLAGPWAVL